MYTPLFDSTFCHCWSVFPSVYLETESLGANLNSTRLGNMSRRRGSHMWLVYHIILCGLWRDSEYSAASLAILLLGVSQPYVPLGQRIWRLSLQGRAGMRANQGEISWCSAMGRNVAFVWRVSPQYSLACHLKEYPR